MLETAVGSSATHISASMTTDRVTLRFAHKNYSQKLRILQKSPPTPKGAWVGLAKKPERRLPVVEVEVERRSTKNEWGRRISFPSNPHVQELTTELGGCSSLVTS